jgi:membrane AbrB-like protein
MTAVTASALSGQRVALPRSMRNVCVTILGVMLGASFTPAVVARMGEWIFTLGALAAWGLTAGAAGWFYFRRVVGYDRVTSYFAAAPGGLNEMTLAGARFGADAAFVATHHLVRIVLVVICAAPLFRIFDPPR